MWCDTNIYFLFVCMCLVGLPPCLVEHVKLSVRLWLLYGWYHRQLMVVLLIVSMIYARGRAVCWIKLWAFSYINKEAFSQQLKLQLNQHRLYCNSSCSSSTINFVQIMKLLICNWELLTPWSLNVQNIKIRVR